MQRPYLVQGSGGREDQVTGATRACTLDGLPACVAVQGPETQPPHQREDVKRGWVGRGSVRELD